MANYLLSCNCGRSVEVSTSMAGEAVRCVCGSELMVPTLRGLRQVPEARLSAQDKTRVARAWTDRHRVTFVLTVIALGAVSLAGYLSITRPAAPIAQALPGPLVTESTPASDVYAVFNELQAGISPKTNIITPDAKEAMEQRTKMNWGIRIALALGACALAAAVASVFIPSGRKHWRAARSIDE
jgi:hypothetical protein